MTREVCTPAPIRWAEYPAMNLDMEIKDSFVVIDSQFPDYIQPLIDSVSQVKGKPIEFLCNTHHHGDHTAGNFAFKNLTQKIVAQKNVPELQ